MMSKVFGLIQLSRPVNGILGALSAILGALLTGGLGSFSGGNKVLLASMSVFLIISGANAINDFFDLEIDRVNRPLRPLPSGRVKKGEALLLSLFLFLLGIFFSAFINLGDFLIALFASSLLFLYSLHLKKKGLAGNLVVSLLSGLVFLFGGLSTLHSASQIFHSLHFLLFPFLFAFLFHLGREVIKDTEDMEGDAKENVTTLPLRYGKIAALRFSFIVFLLLIGITPLPYLFQFYNLFYLLVVLIGVDLFLLLLFLFLFRDPSPGRLNRAGLLLKVDMGVGLLALLLGRI
ncbi:UbiA family prenyltransferase [candidate division TA06 bacterium]|nr:UbiA family prenyltransferase [candidate division TA06 bacterium]